MYDGCRYDDGATAATRRGGETAGCRPASEATAESEGKDDTNSDETTIMTAATITGTVNGNASGMSVGTTAGMPAAATVLGNAAPATTAGATATAGIRPAAVERERARRLIQAALDRAVERGEVAALSWQAVAHGADTVQFFQMRQSIGGCERFHGVVIDRKSVV